MKRALAAAILFASALAIRAQIMTAHVPMSKVAGIEIVQVSLNGTGPYAFILDTGANTTVVKRQVLHQLNVPAEQPVTIASSLGDARHQRAEIGSVAIAGLSVEHVEVNTLEDGQLGALEGRVQGILGENILKNFDLLIDNDRQLLILDRTSSLGDSLSGEHLQLSRSGSFHQAPTADRIVVQLKAPSVLPRPLLFLLDSGANVAMLYPSQGETMQSSHHGSIQSLHTNRSCQVERTNLVVGFHTYSQVQLATCEGMTRDKTDSDGLLPTTIFRQLFISHREDYLIANPQPVAKATAMFDRVAQSR
jgi:predicted aspartyl protease